MSKYKDFIFKDYSFDINSKTLKLYYSYDDMLEFCELYKFDFDYATYNPVELDRAFQALFFMAGVSYYKAFLAHNIVLGKGLIDQPMAEFFSKTYQKGLGEFFYTNRLDPNFPVIFPATQASLLDTSLAGRGLVVAIGGGKDSLVSVELLRSSGFEISTWSLGHKPQLEPLVKAIGLPHFWVERTWDRSLLELNQSDAYNGHIPISAIFACVGTVVAVLSGKRDVVFSNENSANEPDLTYKGVSVNHQYSKSIEFEAGYQGYLGHTNHDIRYYSYLRPFSEVYIAEIFAHIGFDKYKGVFSSCNRAFTHDSNHIFWCGRCPKCAFTFLAFTPFIERSELEAIWHKNLLLDPELEFTYSNLLGIAGDKPLDCVGEIKESRVAMRLAQTIYPELLKYEFEIPEDYDYKEFNKNLMPKELVSQLKKVIASIKL